MRRIASHLDRALRDGTGQDDAELNDLMDAAARVRQAFPQVESPRAGRALFAQAVASRRRRRSSARVLIPAAGLALIGAVVLGAYTSTPEQPLFEVRQVLSSIGLVDDADETAQELYGRATENVALAEGALRAERRGIAMSNARTAIVLLDRARRVLDDEALALDAQIDELEMRAFAVIAALVPAKPDGANRRPPRAGRPGGGRADRAGGKPNANDRRPRDDNDRGPGDPPDGGTEDDDGNTPEPSPTPTPTPTATTDGDGDGRGPPEDSDDRGRERDGGRGSDGSRKVEGADPSPAPEPVATRSPSF